MKPAVITVRNLRETILAWTLIEAAKSQLSAREKRRRFVIPKRDNDLPRMAARVGGERKYHGAMLTGLIELPGGSFQMGSARRVGGSRP
jgi:hypothetical protein